MHRSRAYGRFQMQHQHSRHGDVVRQEEDTMRIFVFANLFLLLAVNVVEAEIHNESETSTRKLSGADVAGFQVTCSFSR